MAGFRAPLFWTGLSAPRKQAGFRTPLPFWHTGAGPNPPPIVDVGGGGDIGYRDDEEILAVIAAYMRVRSPFLRD